MTTAGDTAISTDEIVQWFARSLGEEKAESLIAETCEQHGWTGDSMPLDDVKAMLDVIATEPGLIGMTAMLVKSRLHFVAAASSLSD